MLIATAPPHSHTDAGRQSMNRPTSLSSSIARLVPLCPGWAPRFRPLARRWARVGRAGPSDDGGLEEVCESSLTRSSSACTRCSNCSITTWHSATVGGSRGLNALSAGVVVVASVSGRSDMARGWPQDQPLASAPSSRTSPPDRSDRNSVRQVTSARHAGGEQIPQPALVVVAPRRRRPLIAMANRAF